MKIMIIKMRKAPQLIRINLRTYSTSSQLFRSKKLKLNVNFLIFILLLMLNMLNI